MVVEKRCIRCADIVNILTKGGICILCATETSPKGSHVMLVSKEAICAECGSTARIVAKGLCSPCYQKQYRKDKSEEVPEDKKIVEPEKKESSIPQQLNEKKADPPSVVVTGGDKIILIFTKRDGELLARLKEKADEDRRTVENEILFCLERYVKL